MSVVRRVSWATLIVLLVLFSAPVPSRADVNGHLIIVEPDVFVTAGIPESDSSHSLLIQATSWSSSSYHYILTLSNLSPWPLDSVYVLDRYFPDNAETEEIHHEWSPGRIEPEQAVSFVVTFSDGALPGGCHQLEFNLGGTCRFVLMDCSEPSATTVWNVPLQEEMAASALQSVVAASPAIGRSKVGIHVTRNSSPSIMDFVEETHPAVVVAVGDLGWLADVKRVSPETVTIGRFLEGDQTFEGDPQERAREFVEANAARYLANSGVDYWMGWNEPIIDDVWQMAWYASFEAERTVAMAELGLKVAVGNFSVGTPEVEEFEAFLPALAVAREYGGIFAVHEYSAPTLQEGVGAGIPGLEAMEGCGALTLRFRYWYEHYLLPNDMVLPLVVTELGIDGGVLRAEDLSLMGWRDFHKDISKPLDSENFRAYLEQLSWYDDEMRRDPYVLGFAVFNVGDSGGKWSTFDVTDMLPQLAEMAQDKW